MNDKVKVSVIILAAGSGKRMCMGQTKQTISVCGKSVLKRCAEVFESSDVVSDITIVSKVDEVSFAKTETQCLKKIKNIIIGGKCRAESAKLGFESLDDSTDIVMIHDAARCLITKEEIESVAKAAREFGAATAAVKVKDTLKYCSVEGIVKSTVLRDNLYAAATPQAFSYALYKRAIDNAQAIDESITDDNMLVEAISTPIKCVETYPTNIKITVASDVEFAEFIIRKRENKI